jgi:hypothetical protein
MGQFGGAPGIDNDDETVVVQLAHEGPTGIRLAR